ncbi:MAG: acyl-CoA dehydrogenase family protein [Rhodospirillaceae bacterium]
MAPDTHVQERIEMATPEELVARAAALGPQIFERRFDAAKKRSVPNETIAELIDSKVLRACMPKRFGGYELPFGAHTDVAMELAKHCGSTGWVSGIIGSHNWWLGKYEPDAQAEVWEDNPDALVGAAFASQPGSKGTPKDGGVLVSGTWMWCSGVDHCDWVSLMTPVFTGDGPPDMAMVLLKKGQYTIDDVWYSPGMRATGSNNVIVEDVLVPAHRVTRVAELNTKDSPGCKLNTSAVYKLPMLDVFGYSVAIPTLGCAMSTLDHFVNGMRERAALDNSKVAEFQSLQLRAAESSAEVDAAYSIYRRDLEHMWAAAEADRNLKPDELLKFKRNGAFVATLSKRAATRVIEAMGAGGMTDSNPAHTAFSDTLAGAAHRALAWDINGTLWGKELFGLNDGKTDLERRTEAAKKKA